MWLVPIALADSPCDPTPACATQAPFSLSVTPEASPLSLRATERKSALRRCYALAYPSAPYPALTLLLTVHVKPDGAVHATAALPSPNLPISTCLSAELDTWTFAPGAETTTTLSLVFAPTPPSP